MSKASYIEIKETLEIMLKIEYNSSIKDMENVNFFIDDENNKLIVKNYNSDYEFIDDINGYFIVNDYEYIQQFQNFYVFNECEIIEFDLDVDW